MIPFGSGLRTDSTMIRYGRHWGRLKRASWPGSAGAHVLWAPAQWLLSLIKCCDRCFDKSPAGDHKTTLTFLGRQSELW
ncbi:hypothetical protein [Desulforamulus hydrothermalis]|uniref:hypothetical protein n=1 Tax=Desulforamulus hydrothermalis TaxID=412895 RepID=UPI0013910714|nr:hypothetical protein [Desulforamulus hydrothermalis]